MRIRWRLLAFSLTLALAFGVGSVPANAIDEPQRTPSSPKLCAEPYIAQQLRSKATRVDTYTRPDGRKVTRFYQKPMVTLEPIGAIAMATAETPHWPEAGFEWYVRGETWIEWFGSVPCSGQDGYAFGFSEHCYRGPPPDGYPRTEILCNWDWRGTLELDNGAIHDWDAAWGYREYHETSEGSCIDTGTYHFFPDSVIIELRAWVRGWVRFLSIDHPSEPRKTTSQHVTLPQPLGFHGGLGVGQWLGAAGAAPDGSDANC